MGGNRRGARPPAPRRSADRICARAKKRSLVSSVAVSRADLMAMILAKPRLTASCALMRSIQAFRCGRLLMLTASDLTLRSRGKAAIVGDVVVVADDIRLARQPLVVDIKRLVDLATVAGVTVILRWRGEARKMHELAANRADIRHLHHQPLDHVIAFDRIVRDELAALLAPILATKLRCG